MVVKIVQHTIHVVEMDIALITLMAIGLVNVNFGGVEQFVIISQALEDKSLQLVV